MQMQIFRLRVRVSVRSGYERSLSLKAQTDESDARSELKCHAEIQPSNEHEAGEKLWMKQCSTGRYRLYLFGV